MKYASVGSLKPGSTLVGKVIVSNTPTSGATAAVSLQHITKRFGTSTAVHDLSLTIPRGQVTSLLGPNGAGKTTTIEMCEGFLTPDEGTVRVLGLDPVTQQPELRSHVGIMLQGGGAYPGIRVGELLRLTASYAKNPLSPEWLLNLVGLRDHEKTTYKSLSGGQQQRLSLACALVGRPELIFLDEPTAGLDAQARRLVWELIDALKNDNVSIILTTHHLDEAEALSDNVFIIQKGSLVAAGSPAELSRVAREHSAPHVRMVIDAPADPSVLADRVSALGFHLTSAQFAEVSDPSRGVTEFTVACEPTARAFAALATSCADLYLPLVEISAATPTLEDIFLDITGKDAN